MYTTIKKASDYFNTKLYTGDGTSSRNITGIGFQPDLVWIKDRSAAENNNVTDAVRGATKTLETNTTNAEGTYSTVVPAFLSDGFTIGSSAYVNTNNDNYVSWNWLGANGTASNTDGSITSTVSANTTSGFSIVSYTGTGSTATVGHGLGVAPKMMIVKNRSIVETWRVYHTALGGGQALALNGTNATDTDASYWSNTNPTSSVFTVGTNTGTNGSGNSMIAYCFAEKQGFSKFGSYQGNSSADGTFVYTGFKPAFVLIKRTNLGGNNWFGYDNKRNTYNPENLYLAPNSNGPDATYAALDFLSNGFKNLTTNDGFNVSGSTYIYMAFAEEPLVGDNPATAR